MAEVHVAGPIAVYHYYHPVLRTEAYLFADKHVLEANCPHSVPIEKFLASVISDNPQLHLDLFLESPTLIHGVVEKTPYLNDRRSYIQDVAKQFEPCNYPFDEPPKLLHKKEGKCRYPNLTIHAVDLRPDQPIDIWDIFMDMLEDHRFYDTPEKMAQHVAGVRSRLEDIIKKEGNEINPLQLLVKLYDIDHIMEDQYSHVDPELRAPIMSFLNEKTWQEVPGGADAIINGLADLSNRVIEKKTRGLMGQLIDDLYPYIKIETWILEYFMFARLFSSYPGRGRPRNILYYAGYYHAQTTAELFEELGFLLDEELSTEKQCLDVTPLLPLFNIRNNEK